MRPTPLAAALLACLLALVSCERESEGGRPQAPPAEIVPPMLARLRAEDERAREAAEARAPRAPAFDRWTVEPPAVEEPVPPESIEAATEVGGRKVRALRTSWPDGSPQSLRHVLADARGGAVVDHGPQVRWYENGELATWRHFDEGRQDGAYAEWFESGRPKASGRFVADSRDGTWVEFSPSGRPTLIREFVQGMPSGGTWRMHPRTGRPRAEERWLAGRQVERERQWGEDGLLELSAQWRDGERHGPYLRYYPGGLGRVRGEYEAGREHGTWTRWDERGMRRVEESFVRGTLHGTRREWSESGVLVLEEPYVEGRLEGVRREWWPSGERRSEVSYRQGSPHGRSSFWHENGVRQIEGERVDGEREGAWTYWKADGSVEEAWSGEYVDDEKVAPLPASR